MLNLNTPSDGSITISELVAEYIDDCRIRNLSPQTILWYRTRLSLFFADVWEDELASVTVRQMRGTLLSMPESREASTVNGYLRAAKAMMNYAIDNDYAVGINPRRLKKMKEPRKVPPCFSVEQVQAMLRQPDLSTFIGLRDLTMMSVLLDCGLRLSELTGLLVADVCIPYATVRGKGSKQRIVAMSDEMTKRLRKYLRARQRVVAKSRSDVSFLFPSRYGRRLNSRTVDGILKRYGGMGGVEGVRVSAHTWRFTYTTLALRAGMSLTSLQTCLGHATLAVTRHYAVVNDTDAFSDARACSPLANLPKRR